MTEDIHKQRESRVICPPGFKILKSWYRRVYARQDLNKEQIQSLLSADKELVKKTKKTSVSTVGDWIIKERRSSFLLGMCIPFRNNNKHRLPWRAGNYLRMYGIHVAEPLAYVERKVAGVVVKSWYIFRNLNHCRDVESYLSELILAGVTKESLSDFLHHLALAVKELETVQAYHADLSGKNIYTADGKNFYFIDLEAVQFNVEYDAKKRMKNHVQLYDSFCDALSDLLLVPFLGALMHESLDLRVWMPEVRKAQKERRAQVEASWAKHGQPERINPLRAFRVHI